MKKIFSILLFFLSLSLSANDLELRWAADIESGAPNVFYEGGDLTKLVGFEKDIIENIAERIGRSAVFIPNDWGGLVPGLNRNMYEVVINGICADENRSSDVLFSDAYYACPLSLVVDGKRSKIRSVLDCNGATIGILQNSKSESILVNNLKRIKILEYPNEYYAISALNNGRIDAILLDWQVAAYYSKEFQNLRIIDCFGDIRYSIVLSRKNQDLMAAINGTIARMKQDGTLQSIISRWNLDNENFSNLLKESIDSRSSGEQSDRKYDISPMNSKLDYASILPLFVKGACITLLISISAMTVAIVLGLCLAITRVYMPKILSAVAISIIEFLRGTPLLIQLFFMFYGLPCIGITLRPLTAGILTLGMNYASYEAENFRAGMAAVPHGQMEAARALGMNQWQSLWYIILPQAFTFILPPLTNDFISLIKDSSLVSLITIIELTKAYTIAANNSFNFFIPGIIVAFIYFFLGFPFVRLARWAERHLKLEKRAYFSKKM